MKKIVCVNKCYDGKKVWSEGESKMIDDSASVPDHFKLVGETPVKLPEIVMRYNPMAPVTYRINQPVVPRGGMATGLNTTPINPMPTLGSETVRKAAEEAKSETSVLAPIIKMRGRPRKS